MSLLGRLLSQATPTSTPRTPPLNSTIEESFTYNLLFPPAEALYHNDQGFALSTGTILTPAAINSFDLNGEIDLEMRDVRIIIMQEATFTSASSQLLYDSHALPPQPQSADRQSSSTASNSRDARRSISSPQKGGPGSTSKPVIIQETSTRPFGAFDRRPYHNKTQSFSETEGQRSAREHREELTIFSNCIFGNSEVLAYKGTGTKVHVIPTESKVSMTSSSYMEDANGSFGRSMGMRSSKLAQSFTSDAMHGPPSAGFSSPSISARGADRKKVLITRMFPVTLPNDDLDATNIHNGTPTSQNQNGSETRGYPFPDVGEESSPEKERKNPQPKQKRTPMYAVGLIIHLPQSSATHPSSASRSSFRGSGSYNEQDSLPSSYNSTHRSGWTMLGHGFGVESIESSYTSDRDDRIDMITQHWDVIMRTLTHIQTVATSVLLPMLKQADISSPDPRREMSHNRVPSASISISGKRVLEDTKKFKTPKTNAKLVQLIANCLMPVQSIQKEIDTARHRIVDGIKAYQVVTSQGRWGIWREEARLVGKWAGSKDQGFFFFNLLTGYLGNHTEWLQALGPTWYRRRHYQQQRVNKDDDISLPARTIVVSNDKVMARRLIFLLSAFLPASQQPTVPGGFHRPSTSTSFADYSQSPPSFVAPIYRTESLRRKINKRSGNTKNYHRALSFQLSTNLGPESHHDRRPSDTTSVKTANLPIPGSDLHTRKSSTTTTSTATPITTVPHFSTRRPTRGTGPIPRPGSSGSLVTEDLKRSLARGESSGQFSNDSADSGYNSRWGSMISGFWGSKRRESTSTSVEQSSPDGLEIRVPAYKGLTSTVKKGKLAEMVEEVNSGHSLQPTTQQEREQRKSESGSATTARPEEEQSDDIPEQIVQVAPRIPDPNGAYESPVKTSINERDGVIDIDVPIPDYLSYETAVSSPSSSGYLSTSGLGNGLDGFERYSRTSNDMDTSINVGGWLPRYHPDFALQAIPVQADLVEVIKASMRAEPTPVLNLTNGSHGERWVDISSAVIADTTNFSIKHIRYRRLIRIKDTATTPSHPSYPYSQYGNVYTAAQLTPGIDTLGGYLDEKFIEEPIISMDETLIDAVERIIAQSGGGHQESKPSSACSSRSTSRRGDNRERSSSASNTKIPGVPEHRLEVPRNKCKKMVLSALEEIVREVQESRREKGDLERETERESFLREGVRSWLCSIETQEEINSQN